MKFSYNWIRELVEGVETSPSELGELITMKTAECEGIEPYGAHLDSVCAARVTSVEEIPGSKNRKAAIDAGHRGTKTVVCGAPNCREGMVTAFVPAGTRLKDVEIREAEISGIVSQGMLASGAELGINRDNTGILELEAAPGDSIAGCKPDWIIEIDNKSITHRPDLWGHYGMAREVASILGLPLRDPVEPSLVPDEPSDLEIGIEDFELCPRYSGLTFDNVRVGPSPLWIQYRLEAIDLNPINNIVDVTNFVMAEIAEPMHAFDHEKLTGNQIFVRPARDGESIVGLNDETYALDPSVLVIADRSGPIAIGGVIGGRDTGIGPSTTRMILEAANFKASSIRRTSTKLKLRTDASMRFEKSQDKTNTLRAIARAIALFNQVSPGIRVLGGVADSMLSKAEAPRISLPLDWLERKLGRAVGKQEVVGILRSLEFGVEEDGERTLTVRVPSWRATKDISIKDDLLEEVGRIVGYGSITPRAPEIPASVPPPNAERRFHHALRATTSSQGFTEVYNYSFWSEKTAEACGIDPATLVRVINPIASDQTHMRNSLVPGLWRNIEENSKHFDQFRLFEIGYEIHKQLEGLPNEVDHLAAAIYSREGDGAAGLFELKRLAECLLPGATVRPTEARSIEHPVRAYDVVWRERVAGRLFEFHPRMVEGRAGVLDLDLDVVQELGPPEKRYHPLRRYPSSAFDVSVVAGRRELTGEVQDRIAKLAGASLESIEFLREYTGPPLTEDQRSLSYRLTVFAPDHTLTSEELSAIRQNVIDGMRAAGYELRGVSS